MVGLAPIAATEGLYWLRGSFVAFWVPIIIPLLLNVLFKTVGCLTLLMVACLCIRFKTSFSSHSKFVLFLCEGSWLSGNLFSSLTIVYKVIVSCKFWFVLSKLLIGTYFRARALYISKLFLGLTYSLIPILFNPCIFYSSMVSDFFGLAFSCIWKVSMLCLRALEFLSGLPF